MTFTVQTGKGGEAGMIFARLCAHRDDCDESSPFLFCSKCKAYLSRAEFRFCPWCGHKIQLASKVQIIEANGDEAGIFEEEIDFVRKRVKWE